MSSTTHQTHDPSEKGQTDSFHKLSRLKLPKRLDGKHVLDIGCNEGFFCNQAALLGAERVVGIDIDEKFLAEAYKRYGGVQNISFQKLSWHQLPDEKFDLILWTSAMHYELDPKKVLRNIISRLKPDGLLVLECGVLQQTGREMCYIVRHDGALWYPTKEYIENILYESGFAYRLVSPPEVVGSDPVPRVVYHCSQRATTVILVLGSTNEGKTNLASMLYRAASKVISIDYFLARIFWAKHSFTPFEKYIKDNTDPNSLGGVIEKIDADGLTSEYVMLLSKAIADTDDLVIIEGYMTNKQVLLLHEVIKSRCKVWAISRLKQ